MRKKKSRDIFGLIAKPMRKQRGFSMIEITVAVGLLALLLGTTMAGFGVIKTARFKSAMSSLSSRINYVYNLSIRKKIDLRIVFDIENGKYWAEQSDKPVRIKRAQDDDMGLDDIDFGPDAEIIDVEKILAEHESSMKIDSGGENSAQSFLSAFSGNASDSDSSNKGNEFKFEKLSDKLLKKRNLPDGLKFEKIRIGEQELSDTVTTMALHFFSNGRTQRSLITLAGANEDRYYLSVAPLSGRVVIHEEEPVFEDIR